MGARLQIRNGSNPKLRQRKKNSQQERTSKFVQRSYVCRRYVSCPGEEDGLRDRFLDDVHSLRPIGAPSRRQTCDACAPCAPQAAVRAIARRRRRANAFYEATGIRILADRFRQAACALTAETHDAAFDVGRFGLPCGSSCNRGAYAACCGCQRNADEEQAAARSSRD